MAKKKAARSQALPGMAHRKIEAIEDAAREYAIHRDARMVACKE